MIPADHITFNDDGTAWWVKSGYDSDFPASRLHEIDLPCETCDGTGSAQPDEELDDINLAWATDPDTAELYDCPDCIDGRHTFTLEVDRNAMPMRDGVHAGRSRLVRVSIVPGMVLLIEERKWPQRHERTMVTMHPPDSDCYPRHLLWTLGEKWATEITLPPTAAPGMWAVQLRWVAA